MPSTTTKTTRPGPSSAPDKLALLISAVVEVLALLGVFERLGLDGDGVAHLLGALLMIAAGLRWRGLAKGKVVEVALLFVATGLIGSACAHTPTVAQSVDVAKAATLGASVAVEEIDTPEAAKAQEMLDEIEDALEVLQAIAPALDAQIEQRKAAAAK